MPREVYNQAQPALTALARLEDDITNLQQSINRLYQEVQELIRRAENQVAVLTAADVPIVTAIPVQDARELNAGDRVRITNDISQVRGRPIQERDRLATVRSVTFLRRVYITTDSGIRTWRSAENLQHSPRILGGQNGNRGRDRENPFFIEDGNI